MLIWSCTSTEPTMFHSQMQISFWRCRRSSSQRGQSTHFCTSIVVIARCNPHAFAEKAGSECFCMKSKMTTNSQFPFQQRRPSICLPANSWWVSFRIRFSKFYFNFPLLLLRPFIQQYFEVWMLLKVPHKQQQQMKGFDFSFLLIIREWTTPQG